MSAIENRVRTIIAGVLQAEPGFIHLSTTLFEGVVGKHAPFRIAYEIERTFGIKFSEGEPERWTDVGDVVIAAERLVDERGKEAA